MKFFKLLVSALVFITILFISHQSASLAYAGCQCLCNDNGSCDVIDGPSVYRHGSPDGKTCGGCWGGSCVGECDGGGTPPAPAPLPPSSPVLLPAPTGLNVSCSGNQATFTWNAVSGAGSYLLRFNKQGNNWKDVIHGDAGKTVTGTSFTWSTTSCIAEKDQSGNNVNVCFSPNATYNWWSVQPFKPGEQYPSANPHGGGGSFTCAQATPSAQCFIATEVLGERNGLLSCGQAGAVAYTQHPTTINPFNLSSGDGPKTVFVRFLKLAQDETLQNCNDQTKCLDRSYPIYLSIPACTAFAPEGLTADGNKDVGGVLIPVYKTSDADGSSQSKHLTITKTPSTASVNQPVATGLQFAHAQGNSNDWFVSSIPSNPSTSAPAEYTVTTSIAFAGQTRQCPSFIIRVPAASAVGCECSATNTCTPACTFTNLSGITYANPIKCFLNDNISNTTPVASNKNSWCNRAKRTLGDADGDGDVDYIDYAYYLRTPIGGKIPPTVNTDFNGDGLVSVEDLNIWKRGVGP